MQRADHGAHESRLARSQVAGEGNHLSRPQLGRESCRDALERFQVVRSRVIDLHAVAPGGGEETRSRGAKSSLMWWRANDVLVGVITGVVSAVVAALFELFIVAQRFLSLGQSGGFGSKILVVAIVGAIVGGIVGFFVGAVIKPRSQTR
ncbi:MAG: hypothetical protein ACLPSH_04370 [Vulcanimicrobiaceae bacterium]